ncbi:MAG: hypothetical protein KDJ68_00195 [Rhodobiaceae bacterium]|nr:hypothetical protein [Rhodobiaceae bacterium]
MRGFVFRPCVQCLFKGTIGIRDARGVVQFRVGRHVFAAMLLARFRSNRAFGALQRPVVVGQFARVRVLRDSLTRLVFRLAFIRTRLGAIRLGMQFGDDISRKQGREVAGNRLV